MWPFLLLALTYYLLAVLGVNLGYHRVLTHRSVRLPKWLERTFVTIGLPAGTPIQWVANHRDHHAHADTDLDPHSPRHGFWHAHVGWYLNTKSPLLCLTYSIAGPARMLIDAWIRPHAAMQKELARDVAADPWYAFISRPTPYCIAIHLHAIIPLTLAYWCWGVTGIAGIWLTLVLLYNFGDAINSVSHRSGSARNGWVMALLTMGDGWHQNHHQHPRSARHGLYPGQFDATWQIIRALRAIGWATEIHVPGGH